VGGRILEKRKHLRPSGWKHHAYDLLAGSGCPCFSLRPFAFFVHHIFIGEYLGFINNSEDAL